MDPVLLFLVVTACLLLLGALGEFIFRRTRIPDVIWLVAAGVVMGPVAGVVRVESVAPLVPFFATVALIVILFQGGSTLVLGEVAAAAPRATALAVIGFGLSVGVVAGASVGAAAAGALAWVDPQMAAAWTPAHGVMLGAILGGSSSLVVMPSMAAAGNVGRAARLVEMESTLTDALCIVVAFAAMKFVLDGGGDLGHAAGELGMRFGMAALLGTMAAAAWVPVLHVLQESDHAWIFTLAALFLLYVLVETSGGNPAFGILTFAVVVGNARRIAALLRLPADRMDLGLDRVTRAIHGQAAFIMKSFFFTFIGLSLPREPAALAAGAVLGLLLLAARVPAVRIATAGSDVAPADRRLVTVALPRGMAAGILATYPASMGIAGTARLPGVVFAAVVTSILVFTVGFRFAGSAAAGGGQSGSRGAPAEDAAEAPPRERAA